MANIEKLQNPLKITEIADKINEIIEGGTGGSGLVFGSTIFSLIPLTEVGLHLLDGSLLNVGGIYDEAITKVAALKSSNPNLFITEENWQQQVATYGVCGKFVYTEGVSLRLPKVTGFVEGTLDAGALGDLVEAGLPNIVGSVNRVFSTAGATASGAFSFSSEDTGAQTGGGSGIKRLSFSAEDSNPVYGNSTTVQPQAIKGYLYIVLATSTKTNVQVNIDNVVTELNGKADKDLSNISPEGAVKSIDWIYPDWTAKLNLNTGVDNPIETKGWVLMKNNSLDTVRGYINGIEVFHNYGLSGKWEDYNSLSFPVNTGDVVRLNGGTLLYFPCKGVI